MTTLLLTGLVSFGHRAVHAQTFVDVSAAVLDPDSARCTLEDREGGVVFADFNNDDCLDFIVSSRGLGCGSTLYMCTVDGDKRVFRDMTEEFANGFTEDLGTRAYERSTVAADVDNDGDVDFARNTGNGIQVFLNQGLSPIESNPDYSLGDGDQAADIWLAENGSSLGTDVFPGAI